MTVPFIRSNRQQAHSVFVTHRDDPEPALSELLDDPTLHALMARDGVDRSTLERLIDAARRRLPRQRRQQKAGRYFEASLFVECHAA